MHTTTVILAPLINMLLQALAAVLLAAGTWAIARLMRWLGLQNATQATNAFDDALGKSITFALQQSQDLIRHKGWDDLEVRTTAIGRALPYMIERFPDVLKAVGVDMSDRNSVQKIVSGALDRAFAGAAMVAAASPATPPAPLPVLQTIAAPANQARVGPSLVGALAG